MLIRDNGLTLLFMLVLETLAGCYNVSLLDLEYLLISSEANDLIL